MKRMTTLVLSFGLAALLACGSGQRKDDDAIERASSDVAEPEEVPDDPQRPPDTDPHYGAGGAIGIGPDGDGDDLTPEREDDRNEPAPKDSEPATESSVEAREMPAPDVSPSDVPDGPDVPSSPDGPTEPDVPDPELPEGETGVLGAPELPGDTG